ncbi:ATP-binding protein [Fulvivirga ulvae]|uniref:hybrid sensor histidine kinase/response regulator transcription factor n=1 Tax=Fulvivirga ulvae TaxID=2904245 RepID=UPI001F468B3A|nr:two-component regulator propeller domain-containing protein [Fulvivirga ulvae]UII33041.1 ATP-binding protein [Fulvivirga ulvae]
MKAGILILIVVKLSLLAGQLVSQPQMPIPFKFEYLDVKDGLSHGQVDCILKDSRGYIWIGTSSGLNLFNGYTIKNFTYNPRDTATVNSTIITDLFEDPEGNIWINTPQGVNVYDPKLEIFHQNISNYTRKYGLPDAVITNIVKTAEDVYWFITLDQGVIRYNNQDNTSIHFGQGLKYSIGSNTVSSVRQDSKGDIWVIHNSGLLQKVDGKSLKVTEQYHYLADRFEGQLRNFEMIIDRDNDLWIYLPFEDHGAFRFKSNARQIINYTRDSDPIKLNTNLVTGIVEGADGKIWIGTDHGGINILDKETQTISYLLHNPEIENSLSHNSIYCLYKDDQDIIWVGTYKKGVNYYHGKIRRFPHYKHGLPGSLPYDDVNRFVADAKDNIWIGTNGGGLVYFDRTDNVFTQYKANPADPRSLSSDVIVSMLIDKSNTLWIGTYMGGLNQFDGKHFRRYQRDIENPASIADNNIWELFEDSRGNLWVGTLTGGLDKLKKGDNEFTHYKFSETGSDTTLHVTYIQAIAEDAEGNLWVGGGDGIDIIDLSTNKVKQNSENPDVPYLLPAHTVISLYKDGLGRMWVGTQQGLYVYNEKGTLLEMFTADNGLPHNAILTILEENDHNMWFSTPNGIFNLVIDGPNDLSQVRFVNYDESDGLQGKVFNENAALRTHKGELIFGGANGFNIFDPNELKIKENAPKIVFSDFQLFNRSLGAGELNQGRAILDKSISFTREITLKHDENVFSIEFAAISFLHPGKTKYKYKLEGFDHQWRMADETRRATYTNLDPGSYTFKVLSSNNDGVWNDQNVASIKISVLPPFWKTNWAYALYVMLGLAILYIVRREILQRERVKFRIEQARREAQQMHELDLLKIRFFTNLSHEFRTPLSLILAPLEKLMANAHSQYQKMQYQMINRNARRLLNLLNQLLDFRKLEVDSIGLYTSEGNIIKFIEESVHSFSDLSENKNVTLHFHTKVDELHVAFDMDKLEKILFNLLSNAFKFTPESGRIGVDVNCYDEEKGIKLVEIKVSDTGIGIPKEQQQRVFERFFRNDVPGSVINQGSGIGLAITREFVKIHGGTITVESEPGRGTCFSVSIPMEEVGQKVDIAIKEEIKGSEKENTLECHEPEHIHDEETPLILLVEDSEDFRFYLKDNLGVHFKVMEARNGREGWQKALSCLPDLIVSDLMMPELNGIELCEKLKNDTRTSHIPVVLLTADSAEDKQIKTLSLGADDYITKPFNFEILLSRVKNLILQRKVLQEIYQKKISVETSEMEITSLDDKLIQNAIMVVEENISDPDFTVEMFSRELGLSRVHLYKKLVSLTGTTPIEFIRKIRLQRAAQFLRESQLTVAEVAYKVGFNNRKYFTKHFKAAYKVPPSAYASRQG